MQQIHLFDAVTDKQKQWEFCVFTLSVCQIGKQNNQKTPTNQTDD